MAIDEKEHDHQIATAMANHGGGFVQALSNAWFHGDSVNKNRIKAAFQDYWQLYEKFLKKEKDGS